MTTDTDRQLDELKNKLKDVLIRLHELFHPNSDLLFDYSEEYVQHIRELYNFLSEKTRKL